LTKVKQYQ